MDNRIQITRFDDGIVTTTADELSIEEPMEIRVRGRAISVTMRTPGDDADLAVGFLFSEGIIHKPDDVLRVEPCQRDEFGNVINVLLAPDVFVNFEKLTRHVFASSSCGLCGKATVESVRGKFPAITAESDVSAEVILGLPDALRKTQLTFARTGGLHAAGLFDLQGNLQVLREDVGRHNAVDKVIGFWLQNNQPPAAGRVLMLSGRASFEIMQKALAGGIEIVAAVSAPSSLAVEFAEESNQTLIGFVRGRRMNIYTHPRRVKIA